MPQGTEREREKKPHTRSQTRKNAREMSIMNEFWTDFAPFQWFHLLFCIHAIASLTDLLWLALSGIEIVSVSCINTYITLSDQLFGENDMNWCKNSYGIDRFYTETKSVKH